MNRILILIIGLMSLSVSLSADNAPISTLSNVSACPGSTITINLTVDNFTNIGAVSLRMDYNPDLMTFNDYPASFVSPSLGGALLNMVPVSSGLNKVMISWSGIPGVTMPNGSVLATLSFVLTGGNPVLSFNNSSSGGSECEYANGSGAVLNDSPSSTYYHDAIVTNTAPGPAGMIIGPGTVCQGTSNVTYTVAPIPNAATYIWTIPPGASIVSGGSTNQVTINFSPTAASGNICVLGQNICGNGAISCMVVTMNPLPGATGAISGPTSPCRGSSGIVYSIQPVPNATSYTWSVPSDWNISLGQNTTSITVNVGQVNGNVSVNAGNNCGSSVPSVLAVTAASAPAASAGNDQSVGYGGSVTLNGSATGGSGNYSWHWEPAALLVNPNVQNATTINLTSTVLFTLTVTDQASGCISNDQVLVTVSGGPLSVDATGDPNPVCSGNPVQLMALVSGGTGSNTFSWTSNPPGFTSTLPNPVATPILSTTYRVVVNDGSSTVHDSVEIIAMPLPEIPGKLPVRIQLILKRSFHQYIPFPTNHPHFPTSGRSAPHLQCHFRHHHNRDGELESCFPGECIHKSTGHQ